MNRDTMLKTERRRTLKVSKLVFQNVEVWEDHKTCDPRYISKATAHQAEMIT